MLLDRVCLDIMYCIEISEVKLDVLMPEPLPKPWPMDQLSTLAPCVPLLKEVGLKFACALIRGNRFR
jgi:hypothetical protein